MTENKQAESDLMWNEIKDLPIDMFSLPNQKVSDHVNKLNIPGDQLLLTLNVSSALPALETAIAKCGLEVEQGQKYTIVRRALKEVDLAALVEEKVTDKRPAKPSKR